MKAFKWNWTYNWRVNRRAHEMSILRSFLATLEQCWIWGIWDALMYRYHRLLARQTDEYPPSTIRTGAMRKHLDRIASRASRRNK